MVAARRRFTRSRQTRAPGRAIVRFTLALLLAASVVGVLGTGARPARVGAATNIKVLVTIEKISATQCFDDTLTGCGSPPDFYVRVGLNDGPIVETGQTDDQWTITPNAQFSVDVDRDITPTVRVFIEVRDEDDTLRTDDDFADVNPAAGSPGFNLLVRLGQVPCTFDGTGVSGSCGIPVDFTGDGGDGEAAARIVFRIDVLNLAADADGDGLPDEWEQHGTTLNGQFIDLPAMGADPNKPDIFIHLDYMLSTPPPATPPTSQELRDDAIRDVVIAFAAAPYRSPTGSTGINLHVDQGPGSTLNFLSNATWGGLSRAGAIPWQANLGGGDEDNYDWTQFQAIKSQRFEPTGRSPIFHYAISAYNLSSAKEDSAGGIARGKEDFKVFGASDFILATADDGGPTGDRILQAATLMHELGHNLGLGHGGGDGENNKPNYLSIMNYLFALDGLVRNGVSGVIDYSRSKLPDLDERNLDEARALSVLNAGTGSECPKMGGGFRDQYTINAYGPFDWNCDGDTDDGVVQFDANGNGKIDPKLVGFDDWSNIILKGGQIGGFNRFEQPLITANEPPMRRDNAPPTTVAQVVPAPNGNGWNRAAVTVTLHATDDPGGSGVRDLAYSATGAQPLAATTVIGDTASFVIAAEGVTTITFRAHDFAHNEEAAHTLVVRVDLTDPTVTLGTAAPPPNAAGWNNTDVRVPFVAADTPSGLAATSPPASPLVLTAEGTAVTGTVTATDRADRTTTVTTPAFKIDKTPPTITVTVPTPNQAFDSDQTLTPLFGAIDTLSGLKSIAAVLDTGQVVTSGQPIPLGLLVGRRTLTITATDVADNVATLAVPFRVRPVFVGFAYDDGNESALREGGEAAITGLTVFLDTNSNGRPDAGEPRNATNAIGAFRVVGEDVGPARLCTMPVVAERVRTTSRCQTVNVATGTAVPKVDFGSRARQNGCKTGGVAAVIQSIGLVGRPDDYWRPSALAGAVSGPYAGSRLEVRNGGANPVVQVRTGERVATGLFVGGVDAGQIGNLALDVNYAQSHQRIVAIVAADGSVAGLTATPTTAFAYEAKGNQLTIYGLPQDGLGGYQDIWLITEITAGNGNVTINAGVAGTVVADNGQPRLRSLGNTCNDTAKADIAGGLGGSLPGALPVDDVPDTATRRNPY